MKRILSGKINACGQDPLWSCSPRPLRSWLRSYAKMDCFQSGTTRSALDVRRAHFRLRTDPKHESEMPKHRCSQWGCQVDINPHHLHPVFVDGRRSGSSSLQQQAAMLLLLLNNVPHPAIHRLLSCESQGHRGPMWRTRRRTLSLVVKAAGRMSRRMRRPSRRRMWPSLSRISPRPCNGSSGAEWSRGASRGLVLKRLKPELSQARARGPGAIRKVEWTPIASELLEDQKVILHTDATKSYKTKIRGVLHDRVVHCKKRVKKNGKWKWTPPCYVKIAKHKDPKTGKILKVKAGTQVIDRAWRFLKDRINPSQHATVGTKDLRSMIRSAQYEYWLRNQDLWLASDDLCAWAMAKFMQSP